MAPKTSEVSFDMGEALIRIAGTYPTLLEVILEIVQNALDVMANHINIVFDMQKRIIIVEDNGDGVNQEEFNRALRSVCRSQKEKGKLGRYGIGLVAALGKCSKFTFTSSSKEAGGPYLQWTFDTEAIKKQADGIRIPLATVKGLAYNDGKMLATANAVNWRTQIMVHDFIKDRIIANVTPELIEEGIHDRYSAVMARNKVAVSITFIDELGNKTVKEKIRAKQFQGVPLPEIKLGNEETGESKFHLYLARHKKGKVLVGEIGDDYRFPWADFCRALGLTNNKSWLIPEAQEALSSGFFEGEVTNSKVTLNPSRKSFKCDEALKDFCDAINEWFVEHGLPHMEKAKHNDDLKRLQNLGLDSMKNLENLLSGKDALDLLKVVLSLKGTTGIGHTKPGRGEKEGVQPTKALAARGGVGKTRDAKTPTAPNLLDEQEDPRKPAKNPGHLSYTVMGPSGSERLIVKGEHGLQFAHDEMPGSSKLWVLDREKGTLFFNIRHISWAKCEEKGEKAIMRLQELIAVTALMIESLPNDWKPYAEAFAPDAIDYYASLLVASTAFNLRNKK
jgi:hypothetical protein